MINNPLIARLSFIILLLLKIYPSTAGEGTYITQGLLEGKHVWIKENSPYIVSTLLIKRNAELVISEGVTVKFEAGAILNVTGNLKVEGKLNSPVIFTANHPEPFPGFYTGIKIAQVYQGFSVDFAEFHYAKIAVNISSSLENDSNLRSLKNCKFYSNILAVSGSADVFSCYFIKNEKAVGLIPESKPVYNSYFIDNEIGADTCRYTGFYNCSFIRNRIGVKGVKDHFPTSAQSIINCIYTGNDIAVSIAAKKVPVIKGCKFTSNKVGILFEVDDYQELNSEIRDNTICNNDSNVVVRKVAEVGMEYNCWCSGDSVKISNTIFDAHKPGTSGIINYMPVKEIGCDSTENTGGNPKGYAISGTVNAEGYEVKSAQILLFMTGKIKPVAQTVCESGKFQFKNVEEGVYQIYVIPQPDLYPDFLPTYYAEQIRHKDSELIVADDSVFSVDIKLMKCARYERGEVPFRFTFGYKGKTESDVKSLYDKAWFKNEHWMAGDDQLEYQYMAKHLTVFLHDNKGNIVNWGLTDYRGNITFYMPNEDYTYSIERKGYYQAGEMLLMDSQINLVRDSVTSVTNQKENESIRFYPNPAADFIVLESPEARITSFEMIDLSGGQVFPSFVKENNKTILSVENLPAGFYLIKYHTDMKSGVIRIFKN
jgi:hypothetical protein